MKVLFVDDEVRVLEALERSLEMLLDDDWELEFVDSGAAALARLAAQEFDALVTDMRMPGIDGAELLARARELAPRTVRIVLSGQMEPSNAMRAMEYAHQILGKPCKAELVLDVLRSSTRFRELLERDGFRRAVIGIDHLPAAPTTYRQIEAELAGPTASAATVAAIVARDPGLSARMLQVANSPYFGGGRRIDDIRQAIARLGLQMISGLALAAVFDRSDCDSRELDLTGLARMALRTATICGRLSKTDSAHAYLAGMLTEVGQVVLGITQAEAYDDVMQRAPHHPERLAGVEREVWGVGHAEVGAYLLALWGIPDVVVDAVAGHHGDPIALLDAGAAALVVCTAIAARLAAGDTIEPAVLERADISAALVERALMEAG
jgi:HD-like signal output (HDOD) protein/ActR/RegA family two-component response regulator